MIIHAVSIHSGGGKVLLDHLLIEKTFGEITNLICDERYQLPENIPGNTIIHRIKPTLTERWKAEIRLKQIAAKNPSEEVLCFSNLPPSFEIKNKVILYLQNALLLPKTPLYTDSIKAAIRILYEKCWLKMFWKNIDEVWVQTPWMKESLQNSNIPVIVRPIVLNLPKAKSNQQKKYDFITVSGSATHKRLLELLKAWELIPDPAPKLLVITDEPTKKIKDQLDMVKNKNVTVKLHSTRKEIFEFYEESKCLIITSKIESYCLPIYEAMNFNLKIIAPLEGYSRDLEGNIDIIKDFSITSLTQVIQKARL